jgi:hypothetical protein
MKGGWLVKIQVQVSPSATKRLTRAEIRRVVRMAREEAEFQPNWYQGKTYRRPFTKDGQGYAVALNHRGDELHALVGLRQEITRKRLPGNPEDN